MRFCLIFAGCALVVIGVVCALWLPLPTGGFVRPKHRVVVHTPFTPEEQALMQARAEQIARDPASEWKTPIEFYALVLDEANKPLPGANVKWITTTVFGNGRGSAISGPDGRFFVGTRGKVMNVMVKKDGYRTVEPNAGFEFADFTHSDFYDHDKDNPVVFHLRKIPPFEPIYFREGAVRENLAGNKITIDPQSGRVIQGEST